jgi:glucokinase
MYPHSPLQKAPSITAKGIYEAALEGDELAVKVFDYTGQILGQCLADMVAITSPEAIIVFGGLAQSGDMLLQPTRHYMEENLLYVFKNKVQILASQFPGADAAILGASALAW